VSLLKAADIVEMAMSLEESGEAFYRGVAKRVGSPAVQALFVDLADQEVLHRATFAKLARGVRGKPIMLDDEWDEYLKYLQATVQSALFEGPDKALAAAESVQDAKEAVVMAMSFEKETMLFFHDLRDLAPATDQEIIGRIIGEEKLHLKRLAEML
jgi:rubrerythrin